MNVLYYDAFYLCISYCLGPRKIISCFLIYNCFVTRFINSLRIHWAFAVNLQIIAIDIHKCFSKYKHASAVAWGNADESTDNSDKQYFKTKYGMFTANGKLSVFWGVLKTFFCNVFLSVPLETIIMWVYLF